MHALSLSYRLPAAVRALIQPLYIADGVTLRGRPSAATQPTNTGTYPSTSTSRANGSSTGSSTTSASTSTARSTLVTTGAALAAHSTALRSPAPLLCYGDRRAAAHVAAEHLVMRDVSVAAVVSLSSLANTHSPPHSPLSLRPTAFVDDRCKNVWQQLWGLGHGGGEHEGLFLLVHDEDSSSKVNLAEVHIIEKILSAQPDSCRSRSSSSDDMTSVAIITPHRAQRKLLQQLVEARGWGTNCRVDTVERLQVGTLKSCCPRPRNLHVVSAGLYIYISHPRAAAL